PAPVAQALRVETALGRQPPDSPRNATNERPRTHGGSRPAAPAPAPQWLLAGRSRPVPTARHPRCVPGSRPPLQHRNGSWPDGAAPYPRHATRGVSRPRGARYNGVRYGDVDERGPSGPDGRGGRCRTAWWARTAW